MDMEALRNINFHDLITIDLPDRGSYTFNNYRDRGYEHHPIIGYCTSCEALGISESIDGEYKLTNISHGAHSSDFFLSLKETIDTSDWHHEPIMFVYESPSKDYDEMYSNTLSLNGYNKCPSKDWYWIHSDQDVVSFPKHFKGKRYGDFVLSAIMTFQLANVYMTNLVKCGMNDTEGNFKNISAMRNECIENCYKNFLSREIDLIRPCVIFAVGAAVEGWVRYFVGDRCIVQQLPHPARGQQGFRDEYFKVLYFWLTLRTLYKAGIIKEHESFDHTRIFLEKYENNA